MASCLQASLTGRWEWWALKVLNVRGKLRGSYYPDSLLISSSDAEFFESEATLNDDYNVWQENKKKNHSHYTYI